MEKLGKQLSVQDWETMIDDFQSGPLKQEKWILQYPGLTILELALYYVLRKDFSPKLQLIVFLEEFADVLIKESNIEEGLGSFLDAVRALVQSPVDGVSVTYSLKEQMIVSATSIMITIDGLHKSSRHLEGLTELLLTVINKPNHGYDRQTRAVACECLRELERAFPCLLYEICSHLWNLCQNERTHASQSYILLLTSIIHDLVCVMGNNSRPKSGISVPSAVSILSTSVPLVPFNAPPFLVTSKPGEELDSVPNRELTNTNIKELRRVMAFLLERPQVLTPCGMLEFISMLIHITVVLDLQVSLLKVQFSGLLYSFNPILCHIVLMLYSHFSDAFDGEESEISRRLMLISKDFHQNLVFRLLSIHWLLGFESLSMKKNIKHSIVSMASSYHPSVFDPLAVKALKLDVLAYCAIRLDLSQVGLVRSSSIKQTEQLGLESQSLSGREDMEISVAKLFDDGLVCVSAFKWLPPWSTETTVAFRMLHKFLVAAAPNSVSDPSLVKVFTDSTSFCTLQRMLVDTALEFRRLVPVIVAFADRLLGCETHRWLGRCLLQTFDQHLLSKLVPDHRLASYFPIFDRIAENDSIPPRGLLELLTTFVVTLVESHGPDNGLKSWSQGSKVLGICRKMLMHHHSSRVFSVLSRLLAFTCQCFPDLEVRDNARIYLRMLVCIPGKKLRHILNLGEQLPGVSSSPQLSSFFPGQSPRPSRDIKKSRDVSSYIHFDRVVPLVVKQSWALSIPSLGFEGTGPGYFNGIGETPLPIDVVTEIEPSSDTQILTEMNSLPNEPLRVMDSKVAEILEILRRHFACIPDFRNMPGLRIKIPCTLQFDSSYSDLGHDISSIYDEIDKLPALYAIVINFSSSSPYGSIPSSHIPFLLGTYSRNNNHAMSHHGETSLALVGDKASIEMDVENGSRDEERGNSFRPLVMIELEPREPVPGLIDIKIDANAENGETIQGQLQVISVGIEDMFLKPTIPDDILEDSVPGYLSDLFYALWEACGNSANTGRETFLLRGGKGVVAISGTRSVKLLEVPSDYVVGAVETHLALFVVSVAGGPLVNLVRNNGLIKDVVWKDDAENSTSDIDTSQSYFVGAPLQIEYINDEQDEVEGRLDISKRNMGCFGILIFLPPRFHLLLKMDVSNTSTLVRIRTDHWPCLAYIDDYLEALTST